MIKTARAILTVLVLGLFASSPVRAQTAPASIEVHYQTIVNPDAQPPFGPAFGDMYLKIASDGSISGTYRRFDGTAYGETYAVYGTRTRNSVTLQVRIEPLLSVSGFVNGDRIEGTASNGRDTVGFRALAVN